MKFSLVTDAFEKMSKTTKRTELTEILVELLKSADEDLQSLVYLIEGKLAPDYQGIETQMSDKLIIKALSIVSNIPEEAVSETYSKLGDIGSVAREIAAKKNMRSLVNEDLTVKYVHDTLMRMAKTSGSGSTKARIDAYVDLALSGTPADLMYITRIITGKLRIGVSDATILDAIILAFSDEKYSEEIENAYNFHPDLGYIAVQLRLGNLESVINMGPTPMVPFKVMLAERLRSVDEIVQKMNGKCAFEYKYDGMRTEIHIVDEKVRLFSRGNEETTGQFPDIVKSAKETFHVSSVILDGEAVPYNPETGELYPFQVISQRRGRKYDLDKVSNEIPITVFLFDIVYINGKDLSKTPYAERRRILEGLFKENDNFKLAKRIVSSDTGTITKFFNQAIEDGCEGLVAKSMADDSYYKAGARGWLWIKLKRDYQAQLWDTIDLTVVGAFMGHGRRSGTYGALLLATYNEKNDTFETVCKLGSGFTDDVLFSLPKRFAEFVSKEKPARVVSTIEPDVWIYPSIVMEIIGAEITISPVHTCAFGIIEKDAGLSIRFPRFTGKWRDDKKPEDSTTTQEIIEMYKEQKKTLTEEKS
ncbi:DNA ligase [Thermoplasma volcanium GSS1]|uniref:DNA ligase n=1 Tax=Thermoplasma volcanium (strain ATCC 51530 / DSM 4299 / JCM 9571 / NBRC 15438 / GSS1) TaxID=273116 RepID=DNLI_THEVO|nr:ATP-dependent DNA ligase [Thermoplasma volcanium]Q979A1.1 RecName: Full=DNA ligase; AltName: Full=Polydeoxyribonucleotide synthase [ATP] [Thermoplasma volcanium GSS1]BAB60403.1 DNA ligase [Thermoplasma volcanium GSS1]